MTAMPELVAILHSFVGLAAVLVGLATYLDPDPRSPAPSIVIHDVEIFLGVFIGAITFTGSVVAFGKLRGSISGKPLLLPGRHVSTSAWSVGCGSPALPRRRTDAAGLSPLLLMTAIACVLGVHLVLAIGGADMPVVVSLLNSYSGWAAAAAGFMLTTTCSSSPARWSARAARSSRYIMCRAMNRSI
jgi:H+-translocating NAD(P) transhydrogenase subunit beta